MSAPNLLYLSCLYAAMIPREELTIAPKPSLVKVWFQSLSGTALRTITRYQNICLWHQFTKYLTHFRIRSTNHAANIAIGISHALLAPFYHFLSYQFIQRLAIDELILKFTTGRVGTSLPIQRFLYFPLCRHREMD